MNAKTIAQAAQQLRCSTSTIKRVIRNGLSERSPDGTFDLQALQRVLEAQRLKRGGRPLGGNGSVSPRLLAVKLALAGEELRLARAKRKRAERIEAFESGRLADTAAREREYVRLYSDCKNHLLGVLPQRVALQCGKQVAAIVQQEVENALMELADGLAQINRTGIKQGETDEGPDRLSKQDASARIDGRRPRGSNSTTSSQPSRTERIDRDAIAGGNSQVSIEGQRDL
jgi:hypothetical protein